MILNPIRKNQKIYNKIVKSRKEEVIGTCVRGFHPQFCSWHQNFDLLSTSAKSTKGNKSSIHTRELKRKNQIDNFHLIINNNNKKQLTLLILFVE